MTNATSAAPLSDLTYVIGHRNPDADAICSAIGYAALKELRGDRGYVAARCGNSNERIDTILARFGQSLPIYLSDVTPRVRDVMVTDVTTVAADATCAEALELIDSHDVRLLPVVDAEQRVKGTVSIFQLGRFFIPKLREPLLMRQVRTSVQAIARSLKAKVLHLSSPISVEDLYVRIGAMDIRSFGKFSQHEAVPAAQTIILVGDRWDIQQRSIQIGVRLLVVTGNLDVDDEVIQAAREKNVSVIVSPYDTATSAWIIRSASTLDHLIDEGTTTISADARLSEVRKRIAGVSAFLVAGEDGKLQGIITKTDVLKPVKTRLVLVDHNEMSQSVPGADEVNIVEIIDHHRLAPLSTQQPILFINEPVGSTCTIVADLFRRENHIPSASMAGILMSGIISDTLNLNSPTSTEKDRDLLGWLSGLAGVPAKELADLIFSSGSIILNTSAAKVVRADYKVYEEEGIRFAVSQVEELGFTNFWQHSAELADALGRIAGEEHLHFACLLITDINTQNSLLLVKGDPGFIRRISYAPVDEGEIFDLPGVVSRKKQLIPYLSGLVREILAEGGFPLADLGPARSSGGRRKKPAV